MRNRRTALNCDMPRIPASTSDDVERCTGSAMCSFAGSSVLQSHELEFRNSIHGEFVFLCTLEFRMMDKPDEGIALTPIIPRSR